jgi:hypothetical protein
LRLSILQTENKKGDVIIMAKTIEDNVKQRAFELYINRGGIHGNDQEDWFLAEQEVLGKNDNSKSPKGFKTKR